MTLKEQLELYKRDLVLNIPQMTAVKYSGGKVYYFDRNRILRCDNAESLYGEVHGLSTRYDGSFYIIEPKRLIVGYNGYYNFRIQQMIFHRMRDGDTLNRIYDIVKALKINENREPRRDGVYKYLSRENVSIKFTPENDKYFDYIFVEMNCLSSVTVNDIKQSKNLFDSFVLDKIKSSDRFNKYGISINFLKLGNVVLTADKRLQYTFELKEKLNEICKVD